MAFSTRAAIASRSRLRAPAHPGRPARVMTTLLTAKPTAPIPEKNWSRPN
ncbi:hypothetical protein [Acidocella sp. C78]|nr:hypothetical protein [Acidocella sp. C78]